MPYMAFEIWTNIKQSIFTSVECFIYIENQFSEAMAFISLLNIFEIRMFFPETNKSFSNIFICSITFNNETK